MVRTDPLIHLRADHTEICKSPKLKICKFPDLRFYVCNAKYYTAPQSKTASHNSVYCYNMILFRQPLHKLIRNLGMK